MFSGCFMRNCSSISGNHKNNDNALHFFQAVIICGIEARNQRLLWGFMCAFAEFIVLIPKPISNSKNS